MSEKSLNEFAKENFTRDPEEILKKQLERMKGWFDVTGGKIRFEDVNEDDLNKDQKYLAYLLAALVAEKAGTRDSKFVEHQEANERFGWSEGATAKQQASMHSDKIKTKDGTKAVAKHSIDKAVDEIEGAIEDE